MEEEEEKDEEDDKEIETKKITKKKAKKRKTMMKKIMMTSKDDNKDINENENNKVVEDVENFHTVSSMSQKKRIQKGVLKIKTGQKRRQLDLDFPSSSHSGL